MKSLSSVLKTALEAKNASKPEKTKGKGKKASTDVGHAPSSEIIAPKKTRRNTRGG